MMVHFLPSIHALKDFEEALMSKVRAQRKCIPLTMAVEGILRVLHLVDVEWVPICFCTRSLLFSCQYLLAEQSVYFFRIKLAYQTLVEQPNRLYLLTSLQILSETKLGLGNPVD
jgi:hypothetical protein